MARPREFDEEAVLDAAVQCFWIKGYEATSVREIIARTGLTGASLYNALRDKRALYQQALDHYVESSIAERIRRCSLMPPREAIGTFFGEILKRSPGDHQRKGCMLVNAALAVAPHDPEFRQIVGDVLVSIEHFFRTCIESGQATGAIARAMLAEYLARHLLGVLMGVRILARARPEKALLEGIVKTSLSPLDGPQGRTTKRDTGS